MPVTCTRLGIDVVKKGSVIIESSESSSPGIK